MRFVGIILGVLFSVSSAQATVRAFINHNNTNQYTDPYRQVLRRGDNLEGVILQEISNAKKSIYLAVQELRLPYVAQALIDKKKLGVDVRVVLEHDYNFTVVSQRDSNTETQYEASKLSELYAFVDINRDGKIEKKELLERDAIYMLQQAGIPMIDDASDSSSGSGLMHHKFMVVDERVTIVTTANFTMSCIHGDVLAPASQGNANSMMVIASPTFAKLFVEEFSQMWGNGKRGNFGQSKTYRGPRTVTVAGTKVTVQFSPTSARIPWNESVNGLIGAALSQAQKSIKAALFVFSDQKLANVMEARSDMGASVGVLVEPKFAYRDYSEVLDMLGLEMLSSRCAYEAGNQPWRRPVKEAGMAILPRGDVLHHKFGVVDGKMVIVGSQNWSDSANYTNDESLMVVENKAISDLYTQEYNRLKANSTLGATPALINTIKKLEGSCPK